MDDTRNQENIISFRKYKYEQGYVSCFYSRISSIRHTQIFALNADKSNKSIKKAAPRATGFFRGWRGEINR